MPPSARNPLPFLVPLGAAIALLCVLHYFAPLQLEPVLVYLGLVTALEQYIQEFNHQYHLNVQFETVGIDSSRLLCSVYNNTSVMGGNSFK